jgi:membrane protease YdiL (CAAX protease family)
VTQAPADTTVPTSRPWGAWATFGWAVLAVALGQGMATLALLGYAAGTASLRYTGPVVALATLILNPVQIAVVVAAARRTGTTARGYLALVPFRGHDLVLGILAAALLAAAIAVYAVAAGRALVTPFQIDTYVTTPSVAWLAVLALAIVVVAPLGEEIIFRGFMFRGWVTEGRNPLLPIIAISLVWTLLHVQYDWFGLVQVFLLGLLFGWIRWRSGSTTLAFVLHALVNFESAIETLIKVGWRF